MLTEDSLIATMAHARRTMAPDIRRGVPQEHLDAYITALDLPEDAADALRLWVLAQTCEIVPRRKVVFEPMNNGTLHTLTPAPPSISRTARNGT